MSYILKNKTINIMISFLKNISSLIGYILLIPIFIVGMLMMILSALVSLMIFDNEPTSWKFYKVLDNFCDKIGSYLD